MKPNSQEPQNVIIYSSKADYEMSMWIDQNPETFLVALGLAVAVLILLWLAAVWLEHRRQWKGWKRYK